MKKRITFLALVLVSLAFIGFTDNAVKISARESAVLAKCATPEFNQSYKSSKAVFIGKITNIKIEGNKKIIDFNVQKTWKGVKGKTVQVTVYQSYNYESPYEVGKKYLVYARSEENVGLIDARCSRSREIGDPFIAPDLKKLNKMKK